MNYLKKPKSKKPKSEAFLRNDIRSRIRLLYTWYGQSFKECHARCRVSRTWYRCEGCGEFTRKLEVDHAPPVIRLNEETKDVSLEEYFKRVFCDSENVRGLCSSCHNTVTTFQRLKRKENKNREIPSC